MARYFTCCTSNSMNPGTADEPPTTSKHRVFSHDELRTATSDFSPSTLLGRGSHGSVYLATLDGGRLVAATKLPSSSEENSQQQQCSAVDAEIELLSSLPSSSLLVNLVGATPVGGPSPRIAVVDFMPHGSLHDLLHDPSHPPPPFRRRISLASQAAAALEHLHALGIAHRDVKPFNLLIDSNGRPRLADFGLAVRLSKPRGSSHPDNALPQPAGTMGYIDPGYVRPEDVSMKMDVYSFGIVLLEILSGRRAIDVEYSSPSLVDWAMPLVVEGRFAELYDQWAFPAPGREMKAAREAAETARKCVTAAAEERPTMAEVAVRLWEAEQKVVGGARPTLFRRIPRPANGGRGKRSSSRNGKVSNVTSKTVPIGWQRI